MPADSVDAAALAALAAERERLAKVVEVGVEADGEPQTYEAVFERWFRRFNTHHPEAKKLPHPGFMSLQRAVELVRAEGLTQWPMEALRVVERAQCVTIHMHAHPTELPPFWVDEHVVDTEQWRVRRPADPADDPRCWFGVQVAADMLRAAIDDAKSTRAAGERLEGQIVEHLRDELDHARLDPDAIPVAEQLRKPELPAGAEVRPRLAADAELEAFEHALPPGYELRVTPHGFVVVWRSPPQAAAAQAVRDAWAHHVSAEVLRGR